MVVLRSESPSGKCVKLHTVAASNNRDHTPRSLYCCLFTPHIYRCCSSPTFRSWWTAHSAQRQRSDCRDHSIIACSRHIYILLFFAHVPFVVNHTFNALPPERLQQHLLLCTNRTNRTFSVWRLNPAQPLHPGHSTTLLTIGKPERHVRKASHRGSKQQLSSHATITIIACSRHIYILLFFAHIPFMVNHTINATPLERLQHQQQWKFWSFWTQLL